MNEDKIHHPYPMAIMSIEQDKAHKMVRILPGPS